MYTNHQKTCFLDIESCLSNGWIWIAEETSTCALAAVQRFDNWHEWQVK